MYLTFAINLLVDGGPSLPSHWSLLHYYVSFNSFSFNLPIFYTYRVINVSLKFACMAARLQNIVIINLESIL